ncbi:hypothetical protein A3A74_04745 [Candidatus Roizmanbacteria bacterium RIFCSPLOWO2_01_FULL_35_13]|uniref:Uncharacterized protein n=1 Tax=Candidatus Roizmanbacteria bacterium RIFCSPLOWO2_01_FULL_35_13 TaxID=1802055 RepID=A0A1F7IF56_9BACT|nr:MAG: hypothetical protein A3A74_04745 [Candidatus Roizmanbacteria bacterium RIFCSPLOWO2_01_FULL_35_13]
MTIDDKSRTIILIEKFRLIESEIFRITSKHGVKTIDDFDLLFEKGKLSEKEVGEDIYLLDYLFGEKEKLEIELKKLEIAPKSIWKSFQNLLGLPKLSFRT